jgi:hypothetical protein
MPDACFIAGAIAGAIIATSLCVRWGWRAMNPFE